MNSAAIFTDKSSFPLLDKSRRISLDLAVKIRIINRIFCAQNGVPLGAEVGKLSRELDRGKPVASLNHYHQFRKFRYHVATTRRIISNRKKKNP